ncbi:hypothetical protein TNCT_536941 [Trichonephila clavata]|uniref:Uncharacterized protein n=1 Tax=Trichonephila clavata TaxID=2740835 RepID=A0A8X6LDC1_TRICU|nr:hypothetical protein TNCT_536941 [Trichonephila clavata]
MVVKNNLASLSLLPQYTISCVEVAKNWNIHSKEIDFASEKENDTNYLKDKTHLSDFPVDDDLVPLVVIEPDFRGSDDLFHVAGPQFSVDSDASSFQGHVQKVFIARSVQTQIRCEKQKPGGLPAAEL